MGKRGTGQHDKRTISESVAILEGRQVLERTRTASRLRSTEMKEREERKQDEKGQNEDEQVQKEGDQGQNEEEGKEKEDRNDNEQTDHRNDGRNDDRRNGSDVECKIANQIDIDLKFYRPNTTQQNTPQRKIELDGIVFSNRMVDENQHAGPESTPSENTRTSNDPDDVNIIVNYKDLVGFISENFICHGCRNKVSIKNFNRKTCGIATSLGYECQNKKCKQTSVLHPEMTTHPKEENNSTNNGRSRSDRYEAYGINFKLLLFLQSFGLNAAAARQLSCTLGLTNFCTPFGNFSKMEEAVAAEEIKLTKHLIKEKVLEEMKLSPTDFENGRQMICGTMDGSWINRKSGKAYSSPFGTHVLIGGRTKKVLGIKEFSKVCRKCELDTIHEEELCPKNYEGSSKGMESTGAVQNVLEIFNNYNAYVHTVVIDDDSATKRLLQQSYKEQQQDALKKGLIYLWPMVKDKREKDSGMLPLDHPNPAFLADVNHRMRNMASKFFKLSKKKKIHQNVQKWMQNG